VIRPLQFMIIIYVQLLITSCTGYGLIYDDKRLAADDESKQHEQECLDNPTSACMLQSAVAISAVITDEVTQSEAWNVLAIAYFELGDRTASLNAIEQIPILALQFNTLYELSQRAKLQHKSAADFLTLADTITVDLEQANDKLAALLFNSILAFEHQQSRDAIRRLDQAIVYAKQHSNLSSNESFVQNSNIIDVGFFKMILPQLLQFAPEEAINALIAAHAERYLQIAAEVEYIVLLKHQQPKLARQRLNSLLLEWQNLTEKQQQLATAALVKVLVVFNRLNHAKEIQRQAADLKSRIIISSIIIQQLASQATLATDNHSSIKNAKRQLVELLQQVRGFSEPDSTVIMKLTANQQQAAKQQFLQDKFTLDNLRAQAIADVALGLSNTNKMREAVHLAEQIQIRMGHIQGYTLTKLALQYARQGEFNNALLTMESIHRSVNRAACLAQISAEVVKSGDLQRALVIAERIDRQSWRDIAFSDISIWQARHDNIPAAIKTLDSIQRSYSAVYVMSQIALQIKRPVQASQNKR